MRRNSFGGVLSGPVLIPKVYNGKDKTFFLVNYEGRRERRGTPGTGAVPTLDMRNGDFSELLTPGNRWPVFEERTFRQRRNEVPEPREAAIADVTGDGKNDLILIVHDRVLVYPQE